jgi:pyridoxamine 5'-phosphate oxidase
MTAKNKKQRTRRGVASPMTRFRTWFRAARKAGNPLPESVALATADRRGRPSVRFVLLKEATVDGFVFYTNADSPKGRELNANPCASMVVYWHETGKQVRVTGRVFMLSAAEADAYWETRPLDSRIAALASRQSAPLRSRSDLVNRWRSLKRRFPEGNVPRPPNWTGFQLIPDSIEFWSRKEPRLHHRELFVRKSGTWTCRLLQP